MSDQLVTDELWMKLEPLIPGPKRKNRHVQFAGRKRTDPRKIFNGIVFVLKTGVPWRHLPATSDFPMGQTCRGWLLRWHKMGAWKKLKHVLLAELRKQGRLKLKYAAIDSVSSRAPGSGRKTAPSPVDRRKLGTKHHVITDARGIPLAIILTGANRHDVTQLIPLIEKLPRVGGKKGRPKRKPGALYGDRAYDSEPKRGTLKKNGHQALPSKAKNPSRLRPRQKTLRR